MRGRRSRVLDAAPADVWETAGDPGQLSRWWPRVERVEAHENTGFSEVFQAKSGRSVRADFRIAALEEQKELAFVQQVEGTPFERVLRASRTTIRLEEVDGGARTKVELEVKQEMQGLSRLGSPLAKRALVAQLDEALDGLARVVGGA